MTARELIDQALKLSGLTQTALAFVLGVSSRQIHRWRHGETELLGPPLLLIEVIAVNAWPKAIEQRITEAAALLPDGRGKPRQMEATG